MEKDHFLKILSKIEDRTASSAEEKFFDAYDRLCDFKPDGLSHLSPDEVKTLEKKIRSAIAREIGENVSAVSVTYRPVRWWVAASLFVLLCAGLAVYYSQQRKPLINHIGSAKAILPSTRGAVLTLADGKRIDLSAAGSGLVASLGDTRIVKTSAGTIEYGNSGKFVPGEKAGWNSIVTPRGSSVSIALPDGSMVHLNSGSSLRFPAAFSNAERLVELSGEGEFQVKHEVAKPFRVISAGQKVEVLGTHFNINTYGRSRSSKITLLEGSIALSTTKATRVLKPGEQAVIKSDAEIQIRHLIEAADAVAWRKGIFHFELASIQEVMEVFSLWYDVDIVVDAEVRERSFSGDIHKTLTLEKALRLLNYHHVYFEIDGRKIRVRS